jgi:hypothetical protein
MTEPTIQLNNNTTTRATVMAMMSATIAPKADSNPSGTATVFRIRVTRTIRLNKAA